MLLEFQSTVDKYMSLRMTSYVCALYQDLVRERQVQLKGKLPPVLPIVLCNGRHPWTAPRDMFKLIAQAPDALLRHAPQSDLSPREGEREGGNPY